MNTCSYESGCEVKILAGNKLCKRHEQQINKTRAKAAVPKKRRKFSKNGNGKNLYHDASGKVRPNMGLARLKELDRQRWIQRQEEIVLAIGMAFRRLAGLEKEKKAA